MENFHPAPGGPIRAQRKSITDFLALGERYPREKSVIAGSKTRAV